MVRVGELSRAPCSCSNITATRYSLNKRRCSQNAGVLPRGRVRCHQESISPYRMYGVRTLVTLSLTMRTADVAFQHFIYGPTSFFVGLK
jgi:hypothetical protein